MRVVVVLPCLLLAVGCRSMNCLPGACGEGGAHPICNSATAPGEASGPGCEGPAACPAIAKNGPPQVEVRPAEVIHVKAPAPKVIVETPCAPAAPATVPAAPPMAPPGYPMASMPAIPPPMFAPPVSMVASTTQTTSAPLSRIALGYDFIRIPIPFPRIFALPGPQEVTTRTQYSPAPVAVPFAPFAVAAAPPVPMAAPVALTAVPQMQVAPAAVPPMQVAPACAAPPAPACPALVASAPPSAAAAPENLKQTLDECNKRVQELEQQLNEAANRNGSPWDGRQRRNR